MIKPKFSMILAASLLSITACSKDPNQEIIDASRPLRARNDVNITRGDQIIAQAGSIENLYSLELCGINTPTPPEPGGEEARTALLNLLNRNASPRLTVYWLDNPALGESSDDFAEVFIKVQGDSGEELLFINQEMVKTGLATIDTATIDQCLRKDEILAAQTTS
jgi:endonuclease YncB( thermonuclease family)